VLKTVALQVLKTLLSFVSSIAEIKFPTSALLILSLIELNQFQMSVRKNFNSQRVPRMNEAFPQAVIANNLIFISGTPGLDPKTGQLISADFEQQLRQSFFNIKYILEDAGADITKVVKTTIFMVAGNDFSVINKVYLEFFPEEAPARSVPQVMPFPAGILVSVECIALV
jgi:2-iminobutanoate/2-iminopropanoate deaminase